MRHPRPLSAKTIDNSAKNLARPLHTIFRYRVRVHRRSSSSSSSSIEFPFSHVYAITATLLARWEHVTQPQNFEFSARVPRKLVAAACAPSLRESMPHLSAPVIHSSRSTLDFPSPINPSFCINRAVKVDTSESWSFDLSFDASWTVQYPGTVEKSGVEIPGSPQRATQAPGAQARTLYTLPTRDLRSAEPRTLTHRELTHKSAGTFESSSSISTPTHRLHPPRPNSISEFSRNLCHRFANYFNQLTRSSPETLLATVPTYLTSAFGIHLSRLAQSPWQRGARASPPTCVSAHVAPPMVVCAGARSHIHVLLYLSPTTRPDADSLSRGEGSSVSARKKESVAYRSV